MNAIAMLQACGRGQANQEYDATLPGTHLSPEQPWRDQDTAPDPERPSLYSEDY